MQKMLGTILITICLAVTSSAQAMGRVDDPSPDMPLGEQPFVADGDFEAGLTGLGDSGYGIAMPWQPYQSTVLKYSGKVEYEVIFQPLGAIYSGRLAQRWYGNGPWRGGIYQAFNLPPGLYTFEVWYADPAATGLSDAQKTRFRVGVYDGVSGYEPPVIVQWSSSVKVEPQWNRIYMSGVSLIGRAATLYMETWNDSAVPHNVVVDKVEVRAISFFGQPDVSDQPESGKGSKGKNAPLPR